MTEIKTLNQDDDDDISALLLGRRIVFAEQGQFDAPNNDEIHYWRTFTGKLTLDNGTTVLVAPNEGGCSCSAGNYSLTSLAAFDNVITSVRLAVESEDEDDDGWSYSDKSYRIYVVADAVEINAVQIDGNDGNGYYGTGYELLVVVP